MDNPSAYKFNENKMAFLIVACMRFPDKMIILFLFFTFRGLLGECIFCSVLNIRLHMKNFCFTYLI